MTQENTEVTVTAPLTVREEIDLRLAAIKPEDFIVPDIAPEPDAHFVCTAPAEIRRLFTLRNMLADEGRNLATRTMGDAKDALLQQNLLPRVEALEEANNELAQLVELVELVNRMCWLEIKRQSPILRSKNTIVVYSDWSLCWKEDAERNGGVIVRLIVPRVLDASADETPQPTAQPHGRRLLH